MCKDTKCSDLKAVFYETVQTIFSTMEICSILDGLPPSSMEEHRHLLCGVPLVCVWGS